MTVFRQHGLQVAALCWRATPALELLLVTSLNSKRWILPKGWAEPDMTLAQAAMREAFEEAGVTGEIAPLPVGAYHYLKDRKEGGVPCRVEVFALRVKQVLTDWPEKGMRRLAWVSPKDAVAKVAEPGLRQILRDFAGRQQPARRAV